MSQISADISIVVTARDEGRLLNACIMSVERACTEAERIGLAVERVMLVAVSSAATIAWLDERLPVGWSRFTVAESDIGTARNSIVPDLRGETVAFLQARDLCSRDWLWRSYKDIDSDWTVMHPEFTILFDASFRVIFNRGLRANEANAASVGMSNPFSTGIVATKRLFERVPFPSKKIADGVDSIEWQWTLETLCLGVDHAIAPRTWLYVRTSAAPSNCVGSIRIGRSMLFEPRPCKETNARLAD
jgi:hypothetical protein